MTGEKECPKCGNFSINPTYNFCSECGTELQPIAVCKCGNTLLKHWKHCPKCGEAK